MHPQKLFLREDDNMTCNTKLRRILQFFFFFWIEKTILLVRDYFVSKGHEGAKRILYGSEGQVLRSLQ